MTKIISKTEKSTLIMLLWALAGGIFLLNSFICDYWIHDDGMTAAFSAAVGVAIILLPMMRILFNNITSGRVRMNELAVIAVMAAFIQQNFQMAGGIAFFMLLSLIVESKTASGAHASLEALAKVSPGKARRKNTDKKGPEMLDPEELKPGDIIEIRPGENILADGKIIKGNSSIQEANITGESLPVDKEKDDSVFAGTTNLSSVIEVKVQKAGKNTTLGKVRELILNAEKSKLPFVRMIDKYAFYYTPVILIIALVVWYFTRDFSRSVALLVASCPIALILSTPSAMIAALSAAARLGILIKDVNNIEKIARINAFIFDKTGTLTKGSLAVDKLAPSDGIDSSELLKIAASAEKHSNHPVAKAVKQLASKVNLSLSVPDKLSEKPGRGILATLEKKQVLVGNRAWMKENNIDMTAFPDYKEEENGGFSLLFVVKENKPIGWIGLRDEARDESKEIIATLKEQKLQIVAMVTGDRKSVASQIADELEIEYWNAECIPSEKVDFVKEVKEKGYSAMFIGDGVNDGPALAASDLGIAMGAAGSDVAIESAGITLMNNRLNRIPFLLSLAKSAKHIIIENFVIGGLFIVGGIFLSCIGFLLPIVAAILQVVGSLIIVMNSARLVRKGEDL